LGGGTRKTQIFNFIPNAKIVKEPNVLKGEVFAARKVSCVLPAACGVVKNA